MLENKSGNAHLFPFGQFGPVDFPSSFGYWLWPILEAEQDLFYAHKGHGYIVPKQFGE
jgi:hypothetical protein